MNKNEEKLIKEYLFKVLNQTETNLDLFWILPPFLLSRNILKTRNDVKKFTYEILGIKFRDYVYRSRTILVGQVIRKIYSAELDSVSVKDNVLKYLYKELKENGNKDKNVQTKQNNPENDFFSDWAKFLKK